MPYHLRIFQRVSLCTLSKAFLKSMKLRYTDLSRACTFSIIWRSAKTCSQHERFLRNPACSCRKSLSAASLILLRIMLVSTLPAVDTNAIPLQFAHTVLSPFFGSGTRMLSLQSAGIFSDFHASLQSDCRLLTAMSPHAFSNSACSPSSPADFPFFKVDIALYTSLAVCHSCRCRAVL